MTAPAGVADDSGMLIVAGRTSSSGQRVSRKTAERTGAWRRQKERRSRAESQTGT